MVLGMNNYLEKYGIKYKNEVRMGIGIPDITFNLGANSRIKRLDDYNMMEMLRYIQEKQPTTYEQICKYFNLGMVKVKKYISYLAEMSLVKIKECVIRTSKNIFNTKLGTVISIEAKLKDWKNGFIQAQRYLCFSDYSYLALPSDKIQNVDLDKLRNKGIGLLSVENDKMREVLQPRKSNQCNYSFKYLVTSEILYDNNNIGKKRRRDKIFFEYRS
jgi:predicted transcriptional regulator